MIRTLLSRGTISESLGHYETRAFNYRPAQQIRSISDIFRGGTDRQGESCEWYSHINGKLKAADLQGAVLAVLLIS